MDAKKKEKAGPDSRHRPSARGWGRSQGAVSGDGEESRRGVRDVALEVEIHLVSEKLLIGVVNRLNGRRVRHCRWR